MKNKIWNIIISFIIIIFFIILFNKSKNPILGLSEGIYAVEGKYGRAQIQFEFIKNVDTDSYMFCYTAGNAQILKGVFDIKNGFVIGRSKNSGNKYTFEIKDNNTIIFIEKKSSDLYWPDGITLVKDGTEFVFVEK